MTIDRIKNLDQKILDMQIKKKKMLENLEQTRLRNLKKLGLFDLDEQEIYGLVIDSLSQISKKRGAWKTQGENFLSSGKKAS